MPICSTEAGRILAAYIVHWCAALMNQSVQIQWSTIYELAAAECVANREFAIYGFNYLELLVSLILHQKHAVGLPY